MADRKIRHWQDAVNAVLGIWLVASPWIMGFATDSPATVNMLVVGVLLIAAALGAMMVPRAWEEWSEALLGLWLIASPWVLGFSDLIDERNVALATGVVVAALSLWTLATDKEYSAAWRHDHTAT